MALVNLLKCDHIYSCFLRTRLMAVEADRFPFRHSPLTTHQTSPRITLLQMADIFIYALSEGNRARCLAAPPLTVCTLR